ncbi:MAG: hypothetical protein HY788_06010 [Deltaproteobacteria bacterium]|nr:hypothetical protein [Deltaproteobacteria bacterium]
MAVKTLGHILSQVKRDFQKGDPNETYRNRRITKENGASPLSAHLWPLVRVLGDTGCPLLKPQ